MGLINLVYVSYASHKMSGDELKSLLEEARENNAKLDVTGMLLYRDGFFIQALEGAEDTVMPLYDKIAKDERHNHVLLVYKGKISERTFKDWSMGLRNLDEVDFSNVPGYSDFLDKDFTPQYFEENPNRATGLLKTFKDQSYF